MRSSLASLALLASISLAAYGCGGDDDDPAADAAASIDADTTPDATVTYDAPPAIDATPSYDATPPELGCLGMAIPQNNVPDPLTTAGTAFEFDLNGQTPLAGVDIEARLVSDDSVVAGPVTTPANGTFSLQATSGGVPIDGYFFASHAQKFDTLLYPPTPVYEDANNVVVAMFDQQLLDLLVVFQINQDSSTNGLITVLVLDCDGNPISGATVSSTPAAGSIAYAAGMLPDPNATSTDSTGVAFLFNVPVGTVTVDAEIGGQSLREHDVETDTMTLTTTIVVP